MYFLLNIITSANSRHLVQELANNELEKISNWFASNRLTLHTNKNKFLINSLDKLIEHQLNGVTLQRPRYGL